MSEQEDQRAGSPVAVEVAKAALLEVGLADIAALVRPNGIGIPTITSEAAHRDHRAQIARAFVLGHQAAGHPARLGRGLTQEFEWVDSVECSTCEAELEARHVG